MKALVYEGPRQMYLREVELPDPGPEEVLIKVAYSGICGSELGAYLGLNTLRKPPVVMGHEFSGEIVALGAATSQQHPDLQVGQHVTVNPLSYCGECRQCQAGRQNLCLRRQLIGAHQPGSYAEFVKAQAKMVHPIPAGMRLAHAALTEPLGCALRALRLAEAVPEDFVLVIGLGPIGLLIVQCLLACGVTGIIASDTDPERRAMAGHFGIRALDPRSTDIVGFIQAETNGFGCDVTIDAVGAATTRKQCVDAVAAGGRVVFIGLHEEESMLPVNAIIRREVNVLGTFAYTPADFADALGWLAAGRINLDPWLVTAPLAEGAQWFERLLSGPGPVSKVLLISHE